MQRCIAALVLSLALAGCSTTGVGGARGPDAPRVTVTYDAGTARVAVGYTLTVDFGQINRSIGDAWFIVTAPDPAVLVDRGDDVTSDCDQPGCGGHLTWSFTAAGAGTATVSFRYCYRTQLARCEPRPGEPPTVPIPLEITVTP